MHSLRDRRRHLTATGRRPVFELELFCAGLGDGLVNAFVPHATAGLALMETGSGSEADLLAALERLLPRDGRYGHSHGSPGHGADHLLPALISPSLTLPVIDGRIAFGTWQSLVLVDLNVDNPTAACASASWPRQRADYRPPGTTELTSSGPVTEANCAGVELTSVAQELYGLTPQEFTAARDARVRRGAPSRGQGAGRITQEAAQAYRRGLDGQHAGSRPIG